MRDSAGNGRKRSAMRLSAATLLAVGIFAFDVLTPLQGAVAVLYTVVVMAAARGQDRIAVTASGVGCAILALAGYWISHGGQPLGSPAVRLAVSLVAIATTTWVCRMEVVSARQRRLADERYAAIFKAAGLPIWESDWSYAYSRLASGEVLGPDLIVRTATRASVRDANKAAAQLFGYNAASELIGRDITRHHTASAREAQLRIFAALFRGEEPAEEEVQLVTLEGTTVDVVLRVTLPAHDDGWRHVLITSLDVTQRNRDQARLADSQAKLAHMSRVATLGQLVASIAHEVNQPLSAIVSYARSGRRWLHREPPDLNEAISCLDEIAANGLRAADVIKRIRDHASRAVPAAGTVNPQHIIAETLALLRRPFAAAGITVTTDIAPTLSPVGGDRIQLQQVLINLLLNAEQAMSATKPGHRIIDIVARVDEDVMILEVGDRGCGFGDTDPDTLFQVFVTTKENGMGMGLSISRTIVEQHGGTLSARENSFGGATFAVRLPVLVLAEADA